MTSKAVGYTRISSDREGQQLGVTRQLADIEARAARDGVQLAAVYTDNDRGASSRSKKPRPEYARMIAAAEAGEVNMIYAYSMSRLTRRPAEWETLIQLAERRGVVIRTVASGDPDLSTADGRAVARTIAAWDAAEAERTAERVARKHRERREAGRPNWTWRPFGHERDGTLCQPEADAVRAAARDLRGGATLADICRRWNADPELRPTGSRECWDGPTLGNYMRNPRLAALMPDGESPAAWAPILTVDEWRATVRALDLRAAGRAQPVRDGVARNLLTGADIAHCYKCDARIVVMKRGKNRSYSCKSGHASVPVAEADALVARHLATSLRTGRIAERRYAVPGADTADTDALRAAALAAENVLAEIQMQVESAADPATVQALLGPLTGAQRRLDAARNALADADAAAARAGSLETVLAAWEAQPLGLRRAALREAGLIIILRPGRTVDERLLIAEPDDDSECTPSRIY